MLQRLLISEKKKKSQYQEIQKIPKSYPYAPFTHWDLINRKQILFNKYIYYYLLYYVLFEESIRIRIKL